MRRAWDLDGLDVLRRIKTDPFIETIIRLEIGTSLVEMLVEVTAT